MAPAADIETIKLYYYDPAKDTDETGNVMCSAQGLTSVERMMLKGADRISDTINLLLQGSLTEQEKELGITTEYPLPGLILGGATLSADGMLTLSFLDPENRTGGGSCRVGILWRHIEATALQFPEVKRVRFEPEELFQP